MIKQLSKGKYKIVADIGYTIDGKRKRKSEVFYGTHKEASIRELGLIQENANKPFVVDSKNLTFEEFSNMFIRNYCENNITLKTLEGYKSMLRKINSIIGMWQVKNIDTFALTELYRKLKVGERVKEISNYTLLHYYNLINLMFSQAVIWNLLDTNPNNGTKRPKKEKKLAKCYDMEQLKILYKTLDDECLKYQTLIKLAIDSGARRSEILAITWEDIDFKTRTLTIDKSLDVIKGQVIEKTLKNSSSYRCMVLTDNTIEILKAYQEELKSLSTEWKSTDKLFLAKSGKVMYPTTCGKILQKIATKSGLPKLNFHSLRHLSASFQISLGIHPKEIQDRLGHSSINLTMSTYSHIFQANKVNVANKMNSAINNF